MSSAVQLIRSVDLAAAPYAQAATAPAGTRLVFLAGACPLEDHDVPSTLMGVTVLGYDRQLVEIEAIAACSEDAR